MPLESGNRYVKITLDGVTYEFKRVRIGWLGIWADLPMRITNVSYKARFVNTGYISLRIDGDEYHPADGHSRMRLGREESRKLVIRYAIPWRKYKAGSVGVVTVPGESQTLRVFEFELFGRPW